MNDKESIRENMDTKFPVSYQIDREIRKLAIDESIKGVLHGIDGYIVLSKKNGTPKNSFNVFAKNAKLSNGLYRICYVQIAADHIEVREYKGSRGDRFSAYYPVLKEAMEKEGILHKAEDKYPISDLERIIKCINWVSDMSLTEKYVLQDTGKTYSRIFDGTQYDLPILYYVKKVNEEKTPLQGKLGDLEKIVSELYTKCESGTSEECFGICESLEKIKSLLDKIYDIRDIRKRWKEEKP